MKIIKYLFYLLLLFLLIVFFDMTKINYKYENKRLVEINSKNINSSFIKSIINFIELRHEDLLLKFSEKSKEYWVVEKKSEREILPNIKIIKSATIFTENKYEYIKNKDNWSRSNGNSNSNRFSDLNLINKNNLHQVEIAWIYNSNDRNQSNLDYDIQCNPIAVNGKIYTPTAGGYIVSIDGYNGKEIWRSRKFKDDVARRGIIYWSGDNLHDPRIYFSDHNYLVALSINNGDVIKSFGNNGYTKTGPSKIAPIIYKNYLVTATFDKNIEIYDLISGKLNFKIFFGDDKNERNGGKKYDSHKGSNPWGGFSADLDRGIAYITTGNPGNYFDGTKRPGKNDYSNSVIAVDLENKKILWTFQETSHDIWNLDLPAPAILTSIKKNNKKIDVVVVVTKRGNTLILDRLTGAPIFDLTYKKAPISLLPGEKTSPYQLDLNIPEPFSKNTFSEKDVFYLDKNNKLEIEEVVKSSNYGFFATYQLKKKTIQYNFHGGAEWMGASVDHANQIMYVTANNIPWITEVVKDLDKNYNYKSNFKRFLDKEGYPVTTPPWGILAALNLNNGKLIWTVPFGSYAELEKKGIPKTGTENFGGATATSSGLIFATGTLDKMIYAYDSSNGKELWKRELPFIGSAPPTIYSVKEEQFIIVQSTGSNSLRMGYQIKMGDALVAFKLKK
jgi:quinoprotein glucose dehydrogenase